MTPCSSPGPSDDADGSRRRDDAGTYDLWDDFERSYCWNDDVELPESWEEPDDGAAWDDAEEFADEADLRLVHRVADGLVADTRIRGRHVQVTVQNGVVILEGAVDTAEVRDAAGRCAWSTPGVHDVCNMLMTDDW
ncbi:BON domain-containing protein [Pseudosporangium ferrugineum]|uniref:BON domain-containing protein n=1 Tax=Pseudosporangium ferrugineum TaxID=439699 RepID=A0A2T0RGB0_9ACTN|nr:BON domain-containing protein [Pseudosporangium ferrugineum]PRY20179.1 BON domain-containing protein [Pseudosporangium ferrugineum]